MFYFFFLSLLFKPFFNWGIADLQYSFQMSDIVKIFIDYAPFIVIIKYWLYSLCCTIYPYSLFIAYIVFCTSYKIIHCKVNNWVVFHNLVPRGVHHPKRETLSPFGSHPPRPSLPPALVHHQSVLCSSRFPYSGYSMWKESFRVESSVAGRHSAPCF